MDELQQGFEIAGTGIGVVFAALVSLAVVTALLGKALNRGKAEPASETATPAPAAADAGAASALAESDTDPAMVAAIVVAVHFVRRGLGTLDCPGGAAAVARDGWRVACAGTAGANGLPGVFASALGRTVDDLYLHLKERSANRRNPLRQQFLQ